MFWQEIHRLDQALTLEVNSWNAPITDAIWKFFSEIPVWIPMYVLIVALLIWKLGWKKGLIITAAAFATFGFCDQFSNLIKDAVGRIRPVNDDFMIASGLHILERGGGFSFFSAHSANSFGLAASTVTGLRHCLGARSNTTAPTWLKAYTWWMFSWAALVAISRVFVGRHYLGDVTVGSLVGLIAGYTFARLAILACKRIS